MEPLIGCHISSEISQLVDEVIRVYKAGGNIVQLMIDPFVEISKYKEFLSQLKEKNMKLIIHSFYSLNIARPLDEYSSMIRFFLQEVKVSEELGAIAIVIHLGKKLKLTEKEAYQNMLNNLKFIYEKTKLQILIETSSGQGSEMCHQLPDLAYFIKNLFNNPDNNFADRFGICIDTCHIFAAGYDLRTPEKFKEYISEFDKLIGKKNIKLLHLNDSNSTLGEKKDRHQSIGLGNIGKISLYSIAKAFKDKGIPIILETPFGGHKEELTNLKNL